eukprot:TRINITY_DN2955_c0_g1_i7.p1 TRINITY_DN2955_c0_g1~~TRINITY_DN2955_c0_g1_i7.p1  ORF type:complete len:469 (+),score=38.43 TRINITY_DN2955_c0_g1_i7:655-2061(+)
MKTLDGRFMAYDGIAALHFAAVWIRSGQCDFGHHGPALVTFHRAFIRLYEKAIQAVDPLLALPYWDYLQSGELDLPCTNKFFSDAFFGNCSGNPENGFEVTRGPFASWPIPFGEEAYLLSQMVWGGLGPSNTSNMFGFLRGKDGANKNKYLTRYGPTVSSSRQSPTQASAEECLKESIFGAFILCLDTSGIHPAPHSFIGGATGFPSFEDAIAAEGESLCSSFGSRAECQEAYASAGGIARTYRGQGILDGCLVCDQKCDPLSGNSEDCNCHCPSPVPSHCQPENIVERISNKFGESPPAALSRSWNLLTYSLCSPAGSSGDYSDNGASAFDPIFWGHHAYLDRLVSSWRAAHPNTAWQDLQFTFPSTDSSKYLDVYSFVGLGDSSNSSSISSHPGVVPPGDGNLSGFCSGHGLFDEVAAGSMRGLFRSSHTGKPHTNLELLESIDAQFRSLETAVYIYDEYGPFTGS